jgi:uncharacterized protein
MVLFYVLLIVFTATLIRSTLGFGEALVAVPLLALVIPITVATPLVSVLSVTIGAIVVLQDWRQIHLRSAGWLTGASFFGIPVGLMLLTHSHSVAIKVLLALTIIGFSAYFLVGAGRAVLEEDRISLMIVCGFVAGILGGAYGMNGPPLAVYGTMRRWTAQHFRATLQAYFLPASLAGLVGYWWSGLWVPTVTHYYLFSLPVTIPAVLLGRSLNHRLPTQVFARYVYWGLIVIGLILLIEAVHGRL